MDNVQVCEGCGAEFEDGSGLVDHDGQMLCSGCIQDEEGLDLDDRDDEDDDEVDSDLLVNDEVEDDE